MTNYYKFAIIINMNTVLSLFSGGLAGLCERGISLANLSNQFQVKQFVEHNPYRQHLLKQNFPGVAVWDDIKTFTTEPGIFDVICGGSPCQSNSLANPNRNGFDGVSGLWWEMFRIIDQSKPAICLWENPDGCRHPTKSNPVSPLGQVLRSLESIGYACQWETITASELGAPHQRKRVFVIAYAYGDEQIRNRAIQSPWSGQIGDEIARIRDYSQGRNQHYEPTRVDHGRTTGLYKISRSGWWQANPFEGKISAVVRSECDRAERVAILGDGCTPQQSAVCWKYINYLMGG